MSSEIVVVQTILLLLFYSHQLFSIFSGKKCSQLGYTAACKPIPKEYLMADLEPTLYTEKHSEKVLSASSDSSHSSNASASPSPSQTTSFRSTVLGEPTLGQFFHHSPLLFSCNQSEDESSYLKNI
jgi:hypothetical protein